MSLLLGSIFTLVGDPTFLFSKGWDKAAATKVGVEGGLTHYRVSGLEKGQAADLWVDGQDRPMKLTATSPGASAGASGGTVEIVYSDWGAPITVTAPPADQVGGTALDVTERQVAMPLRAGRRGLGIGNPHLS